MQLNPLYNHVKLMENLAEYLVNMRLKNLSKGIKNFFSLIILMVMISVYTEMMKWEYMLILV